MMRKSSIARSQKKLQKLPSRLHSSDHGLEPDILTLSADLLSDLCDSALSGIVRE